MTPTQLSTIHAGMAQAQSRANREGATIMVYVRLSPFTVWVIGFGDEAPAEYDETMRFEPEEAT